MIIGGSKPENKAKTSVIPGCQIRILQKLPVLSPNGKMEFIIITFRNRKIAQMYYT